MSLILQFYNISLNFAKFVGINQILLYNSIKNKYKRKKKKKGCLQINKPTKKYIRNGTSK